ncbi:MAG: hypothetical protein HKO55_07715 [Gammaproteobacteria bacterium]|nr:hypothetical protein [Gammaproteobacteria bacterium]
MKQASSGIVIPMTSLLLTILLAGCGSGDTEPKTESLDAPPPPTSASSTPPEDQSNPPPEEQSDPPPSEDDDDDGHDGPVLPPPSDPPPSDPPPSDPPPSDPPPSDPPPSDPPPSDPPPDVDIVAPDYVSTGEVVTLAVDSPDSSMTYDWVLETSPPASNAVLTSSGATAEFTTDETGEYSVSLVGTASDGETLSASKSVTALPPGQGPVISHVDIINNATLESNVPLTFGQVFVAGHVQPGFTVSARLENGDTVPLQVDSKAWYADGSLKHAVLSTVVPQLQGGDQLRLELMTCEEYEPAPPVEATVIPDAQNTTVAINISNQTYTASLQQAMSQSTASYWLEGDVVTETHYVAPFLNSSNSEHPLLEALFQLRQYQSGATRVDVIVENTSSFVAGIANQTYTASITAGSTTLMSAQQVPHNHHSRWRQTFWFDTNHDVFLQRDVDYLIESGSVPNYDRSVTVEPGTLAGMASSMASTGNRTGIQRDALMGAGMANEVMTNAGGRPDIGILPGWAASYLLTMDQRAADATFGTGNAAAHWPIHFRDRATRLPVSLETYPEVTTHSNTYNDPSNPLPSCSNCGTDLKPDTAHQPSMAYVPYLLSGDHYFLEELHFWTNWNSFETSAGNRNYSSALYKWQQVRGQAWSMRTLLQTVFVTPDTHPLKNYFQAQLDNNIAFYMTEYVDNPSSNQLNWIRTGAATRSDISPWQDDFFTASLNYGRHLGLDEVLPVLEWKLEFVKNRMTDDVYCWQLATVGKQWVAPDASPSLWFSTMAESWIETLRNSYSNWQEISTLECGTDAMATAASLSSSADFSGFPNHPTGYPATMRPVIAAAVEFNQPWSTLAWQRLVNAPRQPRFYEDPSWAIVPR